MLKALYILAALTGWGPLYDLGVLSYSAATYENQYYEILRLHRESQRLPESERSERAVALADKMLRAYESLEYLSFSHEATDLWCTEGSWQSYLPMEWWTQRQVATARMATTAESLHAEISAEGKPLYSLFLNDMRFWEYRWPWNGLPGEYTEYPYDGRWFRLCRGVDGHVQCLIGGLRRPWVGDPFRTAWFKKEKEKGWGATTKALNWQRMISEGQWIGSLRDRGQSCDLVLLELGEEDDRRDVFFVNEHGFVVLWYIITREAENHRNKWIVLMRYDDLRTDRIPDSEFLPSPALREFSRNWRKLSEAEALAQLKEVEGVDGTQ